MKNVKNVLVLCSFLLILAACGQNETNNDDSNNTSGENESTNDNVENNLENDANEENTENEEANNTSNENVNNNEDNEQEVEENNDIATENNNNTENNHEDSGDENNNAQANNDEATSDDDAATLDSVTLYFADDQLLEIYRVPSDVSVSINESGALEAMELWLEGPSHDGLVNLLPEDVAVQSVEFRDDIAYVSFSNEIYEANLGSSGEGMLTEQVALMMEQFGYPSTMILVDEEEVGEFLGHMDLSEPIRAENPDNYDEM